MSLMEMESVADTFFPNKKNTTYLVAVSVIVDQVMNLKVEQPEADKIEKEVSSNLVCRIFCYELSLYLDIQIQCEIAQCTVHLNFK